MKVIDVLNKKGHEFRSVGTDETLRDILSQLVRHNIGSLVVVSATNVPIGLVTERSVIETLAREGEQAIRAIARSVMLSPPLSCHPQDSVRNAMTSMTLRRTRHLLVADGDAFLGIVSLGDLVKYKLQDAELENLVLRDMAAIRQFQPDRDGLDHAGAVRRW